MSLADTFRCKQKSGMRQLLLQDKVRNDNVRYKVKRHFDLFSHFLKKNPQFSSLFIFLGSNMKTFAAVSVESTITHVTSHSNNTLNNVVTTIAAQVNPPYTTADVLTTSASVNDDVFKSSNLDEEDLQVKLCSNTLKLQAVDCLC